MSGATQSGLISAFIGVILGLLISPFVGLLVTIIIIGPAFAYVLYESGKPQHGTSGLMGLVIVGFFALVLGILVHWIVQAIKQFV